MQPVLQVTWRTIKSRKNGLRTGQNSNAERSLYEATFPAFRSLLFCYYCYSHDLNEIRIDGMCSNSQAAVITLAFFEKLLMMDKVRRSFRQSRISYADVFRRLRKISKSDCWLYHVCPFVRLSLCPSARNNSASTGRIFIKFGIWGFFENLSRKCNFDYNMTRITGALHEGVSTFIIISILFLLRMIYFSGRLLEKTKGLMFSNMFF
jgi:hypothetical protein